MPRKVFISVLGASFYTKCRYVYGEYSSTETRFTQVATLELLTHCSKDDNSYDTTWNRDDQILIFATDTSKKNNWNIAGGKRENRDKEKEDYNGLDYELRNLNLPAQVTLVNILDGKDETEMWTNFETMFNRLEDDDELYIDLTHAFRYLPMLLLVLSNYAKLLKKTTTRFIGYGNFEVRDKKTNVAPLINLTPLSELQDWTTAAADYLNHGDATLLRKRSYERLQPVLSQSNKRDIGSISLNKLTTNLELFSNGILYNRGKDIITGKTISIIQNILSTEINTPDQVVSLKPFIPLIKRISQDALGFQRDDPQNMLRAAIICFNTNNHQSAITLIQEAIITLMCVRNNLNYYNHNQRELINAALKKAYKQFHNEKDYRLKSAEKERIIDNIIGDGLIDKKSCDLFQKISDIRNDFNHAGMKQNPVSSSALENSINQAKEDTIKFFARAEATPPSKHPKIQPRPALLLNLSNHPYDAWDDAQKQAAQSYGECHDIEFPQVDPTVDTDQIIQMADKYVDEIAEMSRQYDVTVHVMGEMTFTYRVVTRLTALGIRCICSTSRRDTYINDKGDKVVSFHFRRFRDYTA